MNLGKLTWKHLTFRPLTLSLNVLLVAMGIGLTSLLWNLQFQIERQLERNLAGVDLIVGAQGSPLQLILSGLYHVDAPTGNIPLKSTKAFFNPKHPIIQLSVPLSLGDSYQGYRIVGTTHELADSIYQATLLSGALWQKDMEVTIGSIVAEKLGLSIGSTFHSGHGLDAESVMVHDDVAPYIVKGIFAPSGSVLDQLILTNTRSVWRVHTHHGDHEASEESTPEVAHDHADHEDHDHVGTMPNPLDSESYMNGQALTAYESESITAILVRYKNNKSIPALNFARNINENTDLNAAQPLYHINKLQETMGSGLEILSLIAVLILIISAISVFISLLNSLRERQYELAIMRVMGARPSRLLSMILLEGACMAFLGGVLGWIISHSVLAIVAPGVFRQFRYVIDPWVWEPTEVWLLPGAIIIGLIAAIIPAIRAFNTPVSTTLTEG